MFKPTNSFYCKFMEHIDFYFLAIGCSYKRLN